LLANTSKHYIWMMLFRSLLKLSILGTITLDFILTTFDIDLHKCEVLCKKISQSVCIRYSKFTLNFKSLAIHFTPLMTNFWQPVQIENTQLKSGIFLRGKLPPRNWYHLCNSELKLYFNKMYAHVVAYINCKS